MYGLILPMFAVRARQLSITSTPFLLIVTLTHSPYIVLLAQKSGSMFFKSSLPVSLTMKGTLQWFINREGCKLIMLHRHKVTKYLCRDGNFRLVHEMNRKLNPDDVALSRSDAYFSDSDLFEAYLKLVGDTDEVRKYFGVLSRF